MALLVSAKGSDVLSWRAAGDFAATFRQLVLDRMEFCRSDQAGSMLDGVLRDLEALADANDTFCSSCDGMIAEAAACHDPVRLKELTAAYYAGLYEHVTLHHSAPAFYQLSILFLHALAGAVRTCVFESLGLSPNRMPELALIALGPAGRQEFSLFCPLQFMLVHGDDEDTELVSRVAYLLQKGFQECGIRVDDMVTPCNPEWRDSVSGWGRRLQTVLGRGRTDEVIEILRLADQVHLDGNVETGSRFRQHSLASIAASSHATNNLVSRVVSLSNGIGMMGGLRFERSGPYRGQFALLENALQPLAASFSVLGLLRQLETTATPRRIRELLWRRELNVDMSERLLQAWHTLHELRLIREREVFPDCSSSAPLYLDIDQMGMGEQETLRESLESVGTIQRHIGLNFSGVGE